MHLLRIVGVVLLGSLVVTGCKAKEQAPVPTEAPTPSLSTASATADELRAKYQKADPDARIGVVLRVNEEFALAAIGEVPVKDFKIGDTVTFMDLGEQIIAHGTVQEIDEGLLVVKYAPSTGGRAPRTSDLAIKVK